MGPWRDEGKAEGGTRRGRGWPGLLYVRLSHEPTPPDLMWVIMFGQYHPDALEKKTTQDYLRFTDLPGILLY